jgi:hypothetical protein
MVLQETKNLNNSKPLREKMIKAAYSRAFGRQATADEIAYWLARSEHFRPLLNAQRIWLYSAQGNKDLRGAVRVALYPKLKREPTAAEIDEGIKKVTPGKLIYTEMVPVLQK